MDIVDLVLILTDGDDEVFVTTKFPSPHNSKQPLRLYFSTPHDEGIAYVEKHFRFDDTQVITTRSTEKKSPKT